jgi:seryl-tRNA synthetase
MTNITQNVENSFLAQLIQHGLLIPSSVKGVYGRNGIFEDVLTRVDNLITTVGREPGTEVMRFPPVLSREVTEQSGYMKSFPHLLGSVHAFTGDHRQHRELVQDIEEHHDWTHHLSPSDVVLTPAACYPVYAAVAGTLPESGRLVDVSSYCFRHEPSDEPARMQSFNILTATAQHAHTACTGFGLERITLALFRVHGFDPTTWTAAVREILWP